MWTSADEKIGRQHEIEFLISAEMIRYEEIILKFSLPDAVFSYELGENGNLRDLASGVVSMAIDYASELK